MVGGAIVAIASAALVVAIGSAQSPQSHPAQSSPTAREAHDPTPHRPGSSHGDSAAPHLPYAIVDTGQDRCFDNQGRVINPAPGEPLFGQDAQYDGNQPSYRDNGDGTVSDLVTGLMWQQTPDWDNKPTWTEAKSNAAQLRLGGYDDWRLPTIKELYSLIDFNGETGMSEYDSIPYIDTDFLDLRHGDDLGERRFIDVQFWSATKYVGTTMNNDPTVFGVNFIDGRIKGYPETRGPERDPHRLYTRYVRGNPAYGTNDFDDNGDGTITDRATGLMWQRGDSGRGLDWPGALAYAEGLELAGHDDWRLPNAKELQSLVDYSRSPATGSGPAIAPEFFHTTDDEPYYWTSTSHLDGRPENRGDYAVYVCFGRAMGYMNMPPHSSTKRFIDVHGAGAQRSDPKVGDPADYPDGHGPQGDDVRIFNFVRAVRDAD